MNYESDPCGQEEDPEPEPSLWEAVGILAFIILMVGAVSVVRYCT